MGVIIAFFVYWLILFVACYIVTEYGQNFLYDETTPAVGLKLALGTLLLAGLATWLRPTFDTMFTSDIAWTALQGIAWFLVFMLILSFHPQHALTIGLSTMVLIVGMASLAVDSLTGETPPSGRTEIRPTAKPLRKPAYVEPAARPIGDPAPAPDQAEKGLP